MSVTQNLPPTVALFTSAKYFSSYFGCPIIKIFLPCGIDDSPFAGLELLICAFKSASPD